MKLRLANAATRTAKREATELATERERAAAKARTPPASPAKPPSPSPRGKQRLEALETAMEAMEAEALELRATIEMLESDVAPSETDASRRRRATSAPPPTPFAR